MSIKPSFMNTAKENRSGDLTYRVKLEKKGLISKAGAQVSR